MDTTTFARQSRRLVRFYGDRTYYRRLFQIALPIALQQFMMASLNMVGVIMIGQLGEAPVAAAGLANQVFFLLSLTLFGITSGAAVFTAQLWGREDVPNIRRVLGLAITLALIVAGIFFVIAVIIPAQALSIYSSDPEVVRLGSQYLRIFGWAFPFAAVSFSYAAVLRSTGNVRTPLIVSSTALTLNMLLGYALILGKFGFPALGIQGAAISALIARVVECAGMVGWTYYLNAPAAARLREMFSYDLEFTKRVLKRVIPVMLNDVLWALGITAYNVVYARIGTNALAAVNIAVAFDNMAFVTFLGIANATAILVGNQIGAGEEAESQRYAGRSLSLGILGALLMGAILLAVSGPILTIYKVSPEVIGDARRILFIIAMLLWLRVSNLVLFIGIFRAGGDTRFAFLLDGLTIWIVGVPLAFIGAFVFGLPIYGVYLLVMAEEFVKFCVGMYRFFSKKWINNLAVGMSE